MGNPTTTTATATIHYEPVLQANEESSAALTAEAEAVPVVGVSNNNTTKNWSDPFYENEPDIQVVLDLDTDSITVYQNQAARKYTFYTMLFFGLYLLYMEIDLVGLAIGFLMFASLSAVLTVVTCKRSRAANNACGIHMALTSSSVRYDQENPMVAKEIALESITSCTITQKTIKPYVCLGTPTSVNLVQLNILGQKAPTVYVGLQDPRAFVRKVMSLKQKNKTKSAATIHQGNVAVASTATAAAAASAVGVDNSIV